MDYLQLANVYNRLESKASKLEKTDIVAQFLEDVDKDELEAVVLLLSGRVYPGWQSQELGLSSSLMIKGIAKAYGIDASKIEDKWRELGDLGLVAEKYSSQKKQSRLFSKSLTVMHVFDSLRRIAEIEGMKSQDKKIDLVCELLGSVSDPVEARYLTRTIIGDLRVGVAEGLLRDSIAYAFFTNVYWKETLLQKVDGGTRLSLVCESVKGRKILVDTELDAFLLKKYDKEYSVLKSENDLIVRDIDGDVEVSKSLCDYVLFYDSVLGKEVKSKIVSAVEHAFSMINDFAAVAMAAREGGLLGLSKLGLTASHPIKVMLYQKAPTIEDAFKIVGKPAAVEYKYDGFRLQVHKIDGDVKLFTRRLEDVTLQFPDVRYSVNKSVKAESFILDCEVIGVDKETGKWLPFQKISRRIKRKHKIEEIIKEIPVIVNFFDVMMVAGKNLIDAPFEERRKMIESIVSESEMVKVAKHIVTSDVRAVDKFYKESLSKGNEGIMMKSLSAPYKPGNRVGYGIKIKPTMDNLDLVVVGADYGEGKRVGWFSSFHLACYDSDSGKFLTIGKMGTGIKEKTEEGMSFEALTDMLKPHIVKEKGKSVVLKPTLLVEVAFEEIQKSSKYSSGFALRFPRLVRLREDRMAEDASTVDEISMLYTGQRGRDT